mgnify:CR=1 FL=1
MKKPDPRTLPSIIDTNKKDELTLSGAITPKAFEDEVTIEEAKTQSNQTSKMNPLFKKMQTRGQKTHDDIESIISEEFDTNSDPPDTTRQVKETVEEHTFRPPSLNDNK